MYLYIVLLIISSINLPVCKSDSSGVDKNDIERIKLIKKPAGQRLVGARSAKHKSEAPFLVGFNIFGKNYVLCTGSLITPTFLISASHCAMDYLPKKRRLRRTERCIKRTEAGKTTRGKRAVRKKHFKLKCRIIWTIDQKTQEEVRNIEIISLYPRGKVWLGRDVIDMSKKIKTGEISKIKRTILPEGAYQGGADYKDYGGYDIIIMELDQPFHNYQPACLPSPTFDDYADSKLAGYGKYFRESWGKKICQTNQWGQMKYHFCNSTCVTYKPPPSSSTCRAFFKNEKIPEDKEEVMIIKGTKKEFCFRSENKENKKYGWCYTNGNYYDPDEGIKHFPDSWGFCSRECFLNKTEKEWGVLRIIDHVRVLPHKLCNNFLHKYLPQGNDTLYIPKILCIGKMHHWRTDVWRYTQEDKFVRWSRNIKDFVKKHHYGEHLGFGGYVASAGTCSGDSGGPVYQEQIDKQTGAKKYIVTGAVSGSRGNMGACGGINSPTHYTRIQSFVSWIIQVIGEPQNRYLCWDSAFEEKLRATGFETLHHSQRTILDS